MKKNALMRMLKRFYRKHFVPLKSKLPSEKRIAGIMKLYESRMGYRFDINNPVLFTEKIQWYKEFYRADGLDRVVDKYLFKGYVEEKLGKGYTIPLLGMWTDVKSLMKDWDSLPDTFVLKSTCQSEGNFIEFVHDKSKVDVKKLKRDLAAWLEPMNTLVNTYCGAYQNVVPRIIAEEYMQQPNGQLYDYKCFCFGGKPFCFYVATDHFVAADFKTYGISFYDLDWNLMDVHYGTHEQNHVPKPQRFDEMVRISEKLSAGFPFVRVDFFETADQLFVAELTLYPGGGLTPYKPESFNRQMGDMFVLPEEYVKR